MTRDDIYDHLAQVYLGKRQKDTKKKKKFNAWLFINVGIAFIIFASAFYGLTAFLTANKGEIAQNVIYSLSRGPVKVRYNFEDSKHPTEILEIGIPHMDANKYSSLHFSIRAREEGNPGVVRITFRNARNEIAHMYIRDINYSWTDIDVPLSDFNEITDWSSLTDVSFTLESWNVENKKGILLIDDICFTS